MPCESNPCVLKEKKNSSAKFKIAGTFVFSLENYEFLLVSLRLIISVAYDFRIFYLCALFKI
jgi:hypothetical protein